MFFKIKFSIEIIIKNIKIIPFNIIIININIDKEIKYIIELKNTNKEIKIIIRINIVKRILLKIKINKKKKKKIKIFNKNIKYFFNYFILKFSIYIAYFKWRGINFKFSFKSYLYDQFRI
jgi:hypothetical protein